MGALVGGVALDLLHFPREAGRQVHAVVSEDVLSGLALWWGVLPALICVMGALALVPYAISRRRHAEIVEHIRAKRAQEARAAP
jgi:Na+/melibiose symporter-like transporter